MWGVLPVDTGDHLDPGDKGGMVSDPDFDMSLQSSQRWLLRFCGRLAKQPFFHNSLGGGGMPLPLSNCFIETFKDWMERPCRDDLSGEDHTPCCEASEFPFESRVFDQCLSHAIGDLYATPLDFWRPGVAGPKFNITSHKVEAVVVEFDSNVTFSFAHSDMAAFHHQVEAWFQV